MFQGHTEPIHDLTMSQDRKYVVSAAGQLRNVPGSKTEDGTVRVWDVPSGKEVSKIDGKGKHFYSVSLSPDGRRLLLRDDRGRRWTDHP